MFSVQAILRSSVQSAAHFSSVRTIMTTPPRVRIPFAEKIVHGLLIAAGVTATPIWIIVHLDDYKRKS